MSEEHDSWLQTAFGVDVGAALQEIQDVAIPSATALVGSAKAMAKDKLLETVGEASGVVKQATEVVDTGLWLGSEYKDARARVVSMAGDDGSIGNQLAGRAFDGVANVLSVGTAGTLSGLGDAADQLKAAGLVDKPAPGQQARASLTASFSKTVDGVAKGIENAVGGPPSDPSLFTPLEKGEIEGAIGAQTALALTGAEEVKVALSVAGALQSVRGIVETIRRNSSWQSDPAFWSGVIGLVLSVVGLKHSMAESKITTLLIRFGWTAQAVPLLLQMKDAYFAEGLSDDERERKVKALWTQVITILKDAILHVAQSPGGPAAAASDEGGAPLSPSTGAAPVSEGNAAPAKSPSPAFEANPAAPAQPTAAAEAGPRANQSGQPVAHNEVELAPSNDSSGLELDTGSAQPWRGEPTGHNEVDLGPSSGASGLDLEPGSGQPAPGAAPNYGEVDLGPLPTGKSPSVYKGSKPVDQIPGVKRQAPTFGPASDEHSGTHQRTGMAYNELNAAEIAQGLNVDYDPVAGRPNAVRYRVDADTDVRAVQTDRSFRPDDSTEGAQAVDSDYTNTGQDRGHLAQREAFKGYAEVEVAADQMTNVVPMHPDLNRGAGSPWRAAETRTMRYADRFGDVSVEVKPQYDSQPPRLPNGTPIPTTINRRVVAPDGTVLEDLTFSNSPGQAGKVQTQVPPTPMS